jgi:hypothetical protein
MHHRRSSSALRLGVAALLTLLSCAVAGCGSGVGEVSGTVSYNGLPLPSGTIQFLGQDGIPRAGKIQQDGTFSVRVPVGETKVIVSCIDESGIRRSAGRATARESRAAPRPLASGNFSRIPGRYSDWNTSGLTVVVKRGRTTQEDFALTSD